MQLKTANRFVITGMKKVFEQVGKTIEARGSGLGFSFKIAAR